MTASNSFYGLSYEELVVLVKILLLATSVLCLSVVRLIWCNARHREMSLEDALTKLPNRRAADILLTSYERRRKVGRLGRPIALLMLDIDKFKNINDTHGHAAGDAVLRAVAEVLRSLYRPEDFVFRVGGEEFLYILYKISPEQALQVAERVRTKLEMVVIYDRDAEAERFRARSLLRLILTSKRTITYVINYLQRTLHVESIKPPEVIAIPVTVSIGLAMIESDQPVPTAKERADQALYTAKNRGRNRVEMAPETGDVPRPD